MLSAFVELHNALLKFMETPKIVYAELSASIHTGSRVRWLQYKVTQPGQSELITHLPGKNEKIETWIDSLATARTFIAEHPTDNGFSYRDPENTGYLLHSARIFCNLALYSHDAVSFIDEQRLEWHPIRKQACE